jgi:hypothetical protein
MASYRYRPWDRRTVNTSSNYLWKHHRQLLSLSEKKVVLRALTQTNARTTFTGKLSRLTYPNWSALAERFWMSCLGWPVRTTCTGCPVSADLSRLTGPGWPVQADLSRLTFPGWPFQADLFQLTCLGWPVSDDQSLCPVWAGLPEQPAQADRSLLTNSVCPEQAE